MQLIFGSTTVMADTQFKQNLNELKVSKNDEFIAAA